MGVSEWEEQGIYFGENGGKDAKWLVLKPPCREINPKSIVDIHVNRIVKGINPRRCPLFHIIYKNHLFHGIYDPIFPYPGFAV